MPVRACRALSGIPCRTAHRATHSTPSPPPAGPTPGCAAALEPDAKENPADWNDDGAFAACIEHIVQLKNCEGPSEKALLRSNAPLRQRALSAKLASRKFPLFKNKISRAFARKPLMRLAKMACGTTARVSAQSLPLCVCKSDDLH